MTTAITIETGDTLRRDLANALRPTEVYEAIIRWCGDQGFHAPIGAYLVARDGGHGLDPGCPHRPDAPRTLKLQGAGVASGQTAIEFTYRGRPLGALLFADEPGLDPDRVRDLVESEMAPALFRTSYLSETVSDNARMREQLYYLDEMGKLLGQLELDLLLVNILELTSDHLGADIGSIILVRHDGELETAVDWGLPHAAITSLTLSDGTRALDRAIQTREPVLLAQDDLSTEEDSPYRFDHLLLLPLCTKDAVWGTINLVAPARVSSIDSEELASTRSGVALAATAVENALLLEIKLAREREQEQLKVAQQIQASLLPSEAPSAPGVDVDGSSVPATMIGGDYFDYFDLPDGRVGLVVADVAGKGVPAGLIMTAARAMFRAAATRHSEPAAILTEVNTLLCAENFGSRFVTAVCVAIDPRAGRITFSTAGHDAPLLYRAATGTVEDHPEPALPLGLRAAATFGEREEALDPGDAAVLFTDGVSEAMDAERNQFGIERIREVLVGCKQSSATEMLKGIVEAVTRHCGSVPRHDDTTLIVARRN